MLITYSRVYSLDPVDEHIDIMRKICASVHAWSAQVELLTSGINLDEKARSSIITSASKPNHIQQFASIFNSCNNEESLESASKIVLPSVLNQYFEFKLALAKAGASSKIITEFTIFTSLKPQAFFLRFNNDLYSFILQNPKILEMYHQVAKSAYDYMTC